MITCTRRLQFCAGHRVFRHESKCHNIHGHNYVVEIKAVASELDSLGRVIDFSVIKEIMGAWIEENWDHGFLVYASDTVARDMLLKLGTKTYVMESNPTAENMAIYLHALGNKLLAQDEVRVLSVVVHETENCWAESVDGQ